MISRILILVLALLVSFPVFAADNLAAKILVEKSARKMYLMSMDGHVMKTYKISLGGDPVGHKTQEGDEKTPEGLYYISARNPNSAYYLSLKISYPNEADKAQARARGVSPGGQIMIHGHKQSFSRSAPFRNSNVWTNGCIAVKNHQMEEIWQLVPVGIPIEIRP